MHGFGHPWISFLRVRFHITAEFGIKARISLIARTEVPDDLLHFLPTVCLERWDALVDAMGRKQE
jgi:hypothetical protein